MWGWSKDEIDPAQPFEAKMKLPFNS